MVRIVTRLGTIRKELEDKEADIDFKIGTIVGKLRAIVADEDVDFKANDVKPIKIQEIKVPANHICLLYAYAENRYGHTIAVGEETPLPISMDRTVDHATFVAALDGEIKKNDLIGVLTLLPTELMR
ncbi:DUF22 domain-containing protein [Methanobacterium aggregans]|uniref:DUF22 domain-containing protein n=1 Tax=Methanobacterium aggregans TaxID=1615586 RepID=UPI001AE5E093|nr:DUF22 domain-containing protein [Methanobacterium aggregans]MBP2046203.1 hypothetical protein [Methanobacterium aggregans]